LPKEEEVIIKSDGSPTYNFCCAIDDALMGINLVIRGEDHISNTPKQVLMYKAFGYAVTEFAHVLDSFA
jgi:glutamyl/glutaminyl-tRNA synthetase